MIILFYTSFSMSNEVPHMESEAIVKNIYDSMNKNDVDGLSEYLAEDVQLIPLFRLSEIISGKAAVIESIIKMLSIAKETKVTFISGPIKMGDYVTVEYTHDYILNGTPAKDHNVSSFIISQGKVKQWIGYIHPK